MKISNDEVQRCLDYLRTPGSRDSGAGTRDLPESVRHLTAGPPLVRPGVVDRIRRNLALDEYATTSSMIAEKIIGRAISDSVR